MEAKLDNVYLLAFDVSGWILWDECWHLSKLSIHQMVFCGIDPVGK